MSDRIMAIYRGLVHIHQCHVNPFQVDFDESAVQTRFVVKPGVDPELDQSKLSK